MAQNLRKSGHRPHWRLVEPQHFRPPATTNGVPPRNFRPPARIFRLPCLIDVARGLELFDSTPFFHPSGPKIFDFAPIFHPSGLKLFNSTPFFRPPATFLGLHAIFPASGHPTGGATPPGGPVFSPPTSKPQPTLDPLPRTPGEVPACGRWGTPHTSQVAVPPPISMIRPLLRLPGRPSSGSPGGGSAPTPPIDGLDRSIDHGRQPVGRRTSGGRRPGPRTFRGL